MLELDAQSLKLQQQRQKKKGDASIEKQGNQQKVKKHCYALM